MLTPSGNGHRAGTRDLWLPHRFSVDHRQPVRLLGSGCRGCFAEHSDRFRRRVSGDFPLRIGNRRRSDGADPRAAIDSGWRRKHIGRAGDERNGQQQSRQGPVEKRNIRHTHCRLHPAPSRSPDGARPPATESDRRLCHKAGTRPKKSMSEILYADVVNEAFPASYLIRRSADGNRPFIDSRDAKKPASPGTQAPSSDFWTECRVTRIRRDGRCGSRPLVLRMHSGTS